MQCCTLVCACWREIMRTWLIIFFRFDKLSGPIWLRIPGMSSWTSERLHSKVQGMDKMIRCMIRVLVAMIHFPKIRQRHAPGSKIRLLNRSQIDQTMNLGPDSLFVVDGPLITKVLAAMEAWTARGRDSCRRGTTGVRWWQRGITGMGGPNSGGRETGLTQTLSLSHPWGSRSGWRCRP